MFRIPGGGNLNRDPSRLACPYAAHGRIAILGPHSQYHIAPTASVVACDISRPTDPDFLNWVIALSVKGVQPGIVAISILRH